jgi:hypothetical protein
LEHYRVCVAPRLEAKRLAEEGRIGHICSMLGDCDNCGHSIMYHLPGIGHICSMLGDCDNCGHSIMYHLPLAGCVKCDCEEFS